MTEKPEFKLAAKLSEEQREHFEKLQLSSNQFGHAAQIDLCVKLIANTLNLLDEDQREKLKTNAIEEVNLRTKKSLLKTLIRISSESSNYEQTVDFVSYDAPAEKARVSELKKVNATAKNAATAAREPFSNTDAKQKLSHEHMVPGAYVFEKVMDSQDEARISLLMNAVGFRALIYRGDNSDKRTEHGRLDGMHKSDIPPLIKSSDVPLKFYPFARYEAAGLYSSLLPVSTRGLALWTEYEQIRPDHFHAGDWKYKDC